MDVRIVIARFKYGYVKLSRQIGKGLNPKQIVHLQVKIAADAFSQAFGTTGLKQTASVAKGQHGIGPDMWRGRVGLGQVDNGDLPGASVDRARSGVTLAFQLVGAFEKNHTASLQGR